MSQKSANKVHASSRPPTKRQIRRAERTEEILDAAMLVVQRDGADGLTIAKVATEADAAVGALYRYFAGKDELLAALQQRAVVAYGTWLGETIERAGGAGDPIASLRESVRSWLKFADEEPQLYALIDASLSNPTPTLSQRSARLVDQTLQKHVMAHVFSLLAAAVSAELIRPGDRRVRAIALWSIAHGSSHFRKRDRLGPRPIADLVAIELVDGLLMRWGYRP